MIEDVLPRVVPWLLLALYMVYLTRRAAVRMRAMTDRYLAESQARHEASMAEWRQHMAALDAEAAARQTAWEAEQAALDAESAEATVGPAR